MEYKKEFLNQNVWVDRLKCFLIANEENKEILIKFTNNIFFENDDSNKEKSVNANSTNVKRKSKSK